MILCLDIGNSQIFGGLFLGANLHTHFRYDTRPVITADDFGTFLRNLLRENEVDYHQISHIVIASVVPYLDDTLCAACMKYLGIEPYMVTHETNTGLTIACDNPAELGADRIANAVGAVTLYPAKNIIIVDFGTATTYCVLTADKRYLGGVIQPGMRLAMESLQQNTAKLSTVPIVQAKHYIGKNTVTNIQAGLYFGQLGASRAIIQGLKEEAFSGESPPLIIGTGGFAHLFQADGLFDIAVPDLVLKGLYAIWERNVK